MRKIIFKCSIKSGLTPFIDIQQKSVALQQNGNAWSGSIALDVNDTLDIAVTVNGINGSPWSVDITVDCPGGSPAKIFSRNGTIPHGGTQTFTTSAKVPQEPCGKEMNVAIARPQVPPKKKPPKTKKKKAKKPTRKARKL